MPTKRNLSCTFIASVTLSSRYRKSDVIFVPWCEAVGVVANAPAMAAHGEREGVEVLPCGSCGGAGVGVDPEDVVPARGIGEDGRGGPRRLAAASPGSHGKPPSLTNLSLSLPLTLRRGAGFADLAPSPLLFFYYFGRVLHDPPAERGRQDGEGDETRSSRRRGSYVFYVFVEDG